MRLMQHESLANTKNITFWAKIRQNKIRIPKTLQISHHRYYNHVWTSNYRIHQQVAVQLNKFRLSNKQLVIEAMNLTCGGMKREQSFSMCTKVPFIYVAS